jgi:hypothetical protein
VVWIAVRGGFLNGVKRMTIERAIVIFILVLLALILLTRFV